MKNSSLIVQKFVLFLFLCELQSTSPAEFYTSVIYFIFYLASLLLITLSPILDQNMHINWNTYIRKCLF